MRGAGFVLLLLLLAGASVVEGQVRGRVVDLRTGTGIAGASVHVFAPGVVREVVTQADGAYIVAGLEPAAYRVVVRHPGYSSADLRVVLAAGSDVVVDVPLEVQPIPVARIVIPVSRTRTQYLTAPGAQDSLIAAIESRQNGTLRTGPTSALTELVLADIDDTPTDPAGGQQPHSLHIWGSSAERGRILLDGATVNAPLHLGAILSPLDPGLLSGIEMRTGGASARYDGGTNYIVEYMTRTPAGDELHAWGELDMLASRIGIEAPLGGGSSVMLGARRVNDEVVNALIDGSFDYEYGDVLARGAVPAGSNGSVTALVLATREMIRIPRDQSDDEASWRNLASVIAWRADEHSAAPSLAASFSRGVVDLPLLSAPDGHLEATLDRASFTAAHAWSIEDVDVDAGFELEHLRLTRISSASADPALPDLPGPFICTPSLPCASASATTAALFTDFAWRAASGIALRAGLRAAVDTDAAHVDLLPRVALSWLGSPNTAATLSFGRFSQLAILEPFADDASFSTSPLQTSTGHATQLELRLAHRTDRIAVEATGFLRRNDESATHPSSTTTPGAEVSWAVLVNGNSISGGYSLLARRPTTDSIARQRLQHLVFMGVGTGAGPVNFDVSAVYGAGVPLTSIVLDRPNTQFYGAPTDDPVAPSDPGPYVRLDAVLSGDWSLELRNRDVQLSPYVKLINAFSRRGALFYYREGGGTDLQPLSALPMMPVVGVRWAF